MRAIETTSLTFAALAAAMTISLIPARADEAIHEVQDTLGVPLYSSAFRNHDVTCVRENCINNPDGSINYQKSYEAAQRPQPGQKE